MRIDLIFVLLSALSSCVNSHVFYFIPDNMNWTSAQKYCRQHHTDLATVDDWTDYDELLNTIPKGFTEHIWIGLYRNNAAAPWVWSDLTKSTFSSWDVGQPNNYGGKQFCASVSPAGKWHDLECPIKHASVCYTVKKRYILRLMVKSNLNDPAVTAEILLQIGKILKQEGLTEDAKILWKIQSDGNVFQKTLPKKGDVTQQTCL